MSPAPKIGVLALQGGVREHAEVLASVGADVVLVRRPAQLEGLEALVLPGGESSAIDKLLRIFELRDPIRALIAEGLPVLGTCAGLILLADRILDAAPGQQQLGGLDATVRRNAFGAQNQSFEIALEAPEVASTPVHAVFIRGPLVEELGPGARPIATLPDGRVVGIAQGALMGVAFHPELAGEDRFHRRLIELALERRGDAAER